MFQMNLEYNKGILFARLKGNLTKKKTYELNNYLIPVLLKHKIKYLVYNLYELNKIDESGINAYKKQQRKNIRLWGKRRNERIIKKITNKRNWQWTDCFKINRGVKMTTEQIIEKNMGLIYKIANQSFYGVEKEDLYQAGVLGILKAIKNYQPNSEAKFSSYAFKSIFGEMYQLAMQKQIKIKKDYLRLYKSLETTRYALAQKWGKIPTNEELALYLEMDPYEIEQAIVAGTIMVSSLDKQSENERSLYETIPENESLSLEDRLTIKEGLEQLNEEERQILEYRYMQDMTQSEVARKLKKTQVMVSRYEKKGIDKIREYYAI